MDAVFDWIAGAALAVTTALGAWLAGMKRKQERHSEKIAVLENRVTEVPDLLREIKNEIHGMRQDGRDRQKGLYEQIEKVRLELKQDLQQKADKA